MPTASLPAPRTDAEKARFGLNTKSRGAQLPAPGSSQALLSMAGRPDAAASFSSVLRSSGVFGIAAGVLLFAGCTSSGAHDARAPVTPGAELPPEERYFPLIDGHIYQYASRGQDGREGFMVLNVARDHNRATLTAGSTVQRLQIRPDGIYNESGYYVLKLPLDVGAQWVGQSGTVEVVRKNETLDTDAGRFTQCLVTREAIQGTVEVRTTESTYCPGVGLVRLNVESKRAAAVEQETVTLQYHGAPIDVHKL